MSSAGPAPSALPGLPIVSPTPQRMEAAGAAVVVRGRAVRVELEDVDDSARSLVVRTFEEAGGRTEIASGNGRVTSGIRVLVGQLGSAAVSRTLQGLRVELPRYLPPEGYVVATDGRTDPATVLLAGVDGDGVYYAAQTLRQLVVRGGGEAAIVGTRVVDYPAVPRRGVIERFGASAWSHAERLDQLAFCGEVKLNTYVYAPAGDPYRRERWRDPYPPAELAALTELAARARVHHVRLVWAVSPAAAGPAAGGICFGSRDDATALLGKLDALYAAGLRDFAVLFDDAALDRWACPEDEAVYGRPAAQTQGGAQVELVNRLEAAFGAAHPDARPFLVLAGEPSGLADSPYKAAWRGSDGFGGVDRRVELGWTGSAPVAPEVTVEQARRAASQTVWGRRVVLIDNFPANDFPAAAGRLLLAPYRKREPGISGELDGILSNPMREAVASRVPLFTIADFAWNDGAYRPGRSWREAVRHLVDRPNRAASKVGGTASEGGRVEASTASAASTVEALEAVEALLAFCDLSYLAPEAAGPPLAARGPGWQAPIRRAIVAALDASPLAEVGQAALGGSWLPQAPLLRREIERFWSAWDADPAEAIATFRPHAQRLAAAPALIRRRVIDPHFVAETSPWLDAMALWGSALLAALDGTEALLDGARAEAEDRFAEAARSVRRAGELRTHAGSIQEGASVRLGDGVLDRLVDRLIRA